MRAGGSWGRYITDSGDTVFVPVSLDPYCLERLGYIEPVEVAADGTHDASTFWSGKGYQCLRVPTSTEGEYYLVETGSTTIKKSRNTTTKRAASSSGISTGESRTRAA